MVSLPFARSLPPAQPPARSYHPVRRTPVSASRSASRDCAMDSALKGTGIRPLGPPATVSSVHMAARRDPRRQLNAHIASLAANSRRPRPSRNGDILSNRNDISLHSVLLSAAPPYVCIPAPAQSRRSPPRAAGRIQSLSSPHPPADNLQANR